MMARPASTPIVVVAAPLPPLSVRTPSPLDDQFTLPDPESVMSSPRARTLSLDHLEEEPTRASETFSQTPKVATWLRTVSRLSRLRAQARGEPVEERRSESVGSTTSEERRQMQAHLKKSLEKTEYDVSMYYWPKDQLGYRGRASALARHGIFERTTLAVIVANAMWQAYDVDHNNAVLSESPVQFRIAEHLFCAYFSFEWTVRFVAFESKRNCFKDSWFVFDSILVSTMVVETWIVTLIMEIAAGGSSGGSALGDSSLLRIARLMRLSRMMRMGRLLRAVPELLIQLKGLGQAMRSVLTSLALLLICNYACAVLIRTTMDQGSVVQTLHFDSVPKSMYTLLIYAFFLDALGYIYTAFFAGGHWGIALVFSLCVIGTGLAMQNMLVGVLCEVVSGVGVEERASLKRQEVEEKLNIAVVMMGCKDRMVTKDNFMRIFDSSNDEPSIAELFGDVGVDLIGLLDFSDFIFHDELLDEADKILSFDEFVDVLMQLRGEREATVKDMVDLRKYLRHQIRDLGTARSEQLHALQNGLSRQHDRVIRKLTRMSDRLGKPPLGGIPPALEASAAAVAEPGTYTGRLRRVECALAYAKEELRALKVDIDQTPLKAEGHDRATVQAGSERPGPGLERAASVT